MSLISETPLGTPFVPNESITDSAYSFAAFLTSVSYLFRFELFE